MCAFVILRMLTNSRDQLDYQRCLKTIVSHVMDRLDSYLLRFDFIYSLTNRGRTYFDAIKRTKELARGVIREKRKNLKVYGLNKYSQNRSLEFEKGIWIYGDKSQITLNAISFSYIL